MKQKMDRCPLPTAYRNGQAMRPRVVPDPCDYCGSLLAQCGCFGPWFWNRTGREVRKDAGEGWDVFLPQSGRAWVEADGSLGGLPQKAYPGHFFIVSRAVKRAAEALGREDVLLIPDVVVSVEDGTVYVGIVPDDYWDR